MLGLALIVGPGAAAQVANPVLTARANGIRDEAHARPLQLRRLDLSVEQRGGVVETTVTAAFANPEREQLEGDFRLTLPEGAVVTGYALDIGGRMVDGVLVDRPRAKAVYEARVRQRVDPGLAEVGADNVFSTRVFPIWPGSGRTIRVSFVAPVGAKGWRLPLGFDAPAEGWSVRVHATGLAGAPVVTLGDAPLAMTAQGDGFQAERAAKGVLPPGALAIAPTRVADLVASTHRNGEHDVQLSGDLPATAAGAAAPARLRIYWDRSRSRLKADTAREIALVRAAITDWRPGTVELVAFNSSGALRQTVATADEAAAWLAALSYRGATSLASIGRDGPADRCLMFTDGRATIDRGATIGAACPIDVVSSAGDDDRTWAGHLARAHGGRLILLDGDPAAAVAQMRVPGTGVTAVVDRDGRPVPFVPLPAPAGRWSILTRAPGFGPVTVRLDGGQSIVRAVEGAGVAFDGPGALLAQDQLAELGGTDQRDAFVALSRRYGIASPSLSFLVLESVNDYLAAKIDPPATLPAEWRDDYARARKAADSNDAAQAQRHRENLVNEWREQVAWWKTKFDPAAVPKRIATSRSFDRTAPGGAPPPPPPPPPPPAPAAPPAPPAPPAPRVSPMAGNIVVSASRAGAESGPAAPSVQIDAWQPDRPYLELYDGKPADFAERFREAEARHGALPIFYLDTAAWLAKRGQMAEAQEMVLSALELPTADDTTLGMVADRLERYGAWDRAVELRERQAMLDPDRPQPRRLLALTLARRARAQPATARADLTRAITLLYDVAITPQSGLWEGIALISLNEANAMLPRLRRLGGTVDMDPRLVGLLDVDVRVVIDWTSDASDMDLWVDEPSSERAIYNNNRTAIGGRLSNDMTRGYGPEEYMVHVAPPGTYTAQANVFAPDRIDPNGATILTAHLFRNFGRANETVDSVDIELKRDEKGARMIGRVVVSAKKGAPQR
ncbi:VIT domain-containing protein [Sphingomonas sp. PB1R3]|uniref:VIT domain-containing protein n=1 Tax=Sphingomonas flavida TaxID=3096154 RepID=UPI002FC72176